MAEKNAAPPAPPTIITLTLPALDAEPATMLIQRGELAHIRLFPLKDDNGDQIDIHTIIEQAYTALAAVEAAPPVIPAPPEPPKLAPRPVSSTHVTGHAPKAKPQEPMISLEVGKTTRGHGITHRFPERFLQLAQPDRKPLALLLVTKLIEGKLWDTKSPICIDDVPALEQKLRHLSAKELVLFSLSDFVQPGEDIPWEPPAAPEPEPVIEAEEIEEEEGDPEEVDE